MPSPGVPISSVMSYWQKAEGRRLAMARDRKELSE